MNPVMVMVNYIESQAKDKNPSLGEMSVSSALLSNNTALPKSTFPYHLLELCQKLDT